MSFEVKKQKQVMVSASGPYLLPHVTVNLKKSEGSTYIISLRFYLNHWVLIITLSLYYKRVKTRQDWKHRMSANKCKVYINIQKIGKNARCS